MYVEVIWHMERMNEVEWRKGYIELTLDEDRYGLHSHIESRKFLVIVVIFTALML